MKSIKVLVVDDSLFMRRLISRFLSEDPELEIMDTAKNGVEAVEKAKLLRPDVITMDVEMPEMNGLEALKRIMADRPTPVVMLSSLTTVGARVTIEALQSGAVDFVTKPSGSISADLYKVKQELITKVKVAAGTNLAVFRQSAPGTRPTAKREEKPSSPHAASPDPSVQSTKSAPAARLSSAAKSGHVAPPVQTAKPSVYADFDQIVGIGTSTGGPKALEAVLSKLPENFPYPVLVVQHMPPNFTRSLAERLDRMCAIKVIEAEDKMQIYGGMVYIAPGDYHMMVRKKKNRYFIEINQDAERNHHRPSVDVLFESMTALSGLKKHFVIMTGMGSDGFQAISTAKNDTQNPCTVIAESQETCIVYGMPRAVVERNCADYVVPLYDIADTLLKVTKSEN